MIKRNLVSSLAVCALFFPALSFAGVTALKGEGGEKLYIQSAGSLGADAVVLMFEGVDSPWNGKVIKAKLVKFGGAGDPDARLDRYDIAYERLLSSGPQKKTWGAAIQKGYELIKGTRVKKYITYFAGGSNSGVEMNYDPELTDKSQAMNLLEKFKKSPYKPDGDL